MHKFPLVATTPQLITPYGTRTFATAENFPILKRLSVYRLLIRPGCFREPHWHANADELGYCLAGSALVTIFASGNEHHRFTVAEGDMFFVPSGALHAIENTGDGDAEFVITFSHERVEDFGLSGFAGCLSPAVLGNTFNLAAGELEGITRSPQSIHLGRLSGPVEIPESAAYPSPYKFLISQRAPLVQNENGSATVARRDTWPALRNQAMYSVRIRSVGMREPHWHPETAELGFVRQGHARMTVQSPDGSAETYELQAGDVYFIPCAYPHHIENLGESELHFLIFFDTPDVKDIGFTGAVPEFDAHLVAPTLGISIAQYQMIPRRPADLLIVGKVNPAD